MLNLKVTKSDANQRADVFLAGNLPQYSRSSLSGLFDKQMVSVNKLPIKASRKLRAGEKLAIDTALLYARPKTINIPVIYEDKDVIVMNKPAGVLTHSKGALNTEATLASFIEPKVADKNLKGNRAGIVHRLDRGTSGVITAAKNEKTLKWLQKQFSTRKVKKTYLAIVEGVPEPRAAIIDAPIERNPNKPQTFRVSSSGRPAQTEYKLIKILDKSSIFNETSLSDKLALLELQPLSGRTHQLRVHLKYIGHPIVGDRVYGRAGDPTKISKKFQAGKHLLLHAKSLELTLPGGRRKVFEAPEPGYFLELAQS
ncbi:RluA family pseudouridine synthase [Candidatus Saccharibacteria bacterium]|nr:RluA family pseudouridine synthase [Candidatus Saccharibacteria bacterium]